MVQLRTQVGIVGAGPAGLMLGHLLHLRGIDSVHHRKSSEEHVIERVRAGVLEQSTVDLMHEGGLGQRLPPRHAPRRDLPGFGGERHRIPMAELTAAGRITIYGQNEVVKDLIGARWPPAGRCFSRSTRDCSRRRFFAPKIRFRTKDELHEIACDFIAGCDGSHGICRPSIPADRVQI